MLYTNVDVQCDKLVIGSLLTNDNACGGLRQKFSQVQSLLKSSRGSTMPLSLEIREFPYNAAYCPYNAVHHKSMPKMSQICKVVSIKQHVMDTQTDTHSPTANSTLTSCHIWDMILQ